MSRAIVQSGNGLGAFSREQAARVTHRAATLLSVEPTAAGFSNVPDHQLVAVGSQLAGLDTNSLGAHRQSVASWARHTPSSLPFVFDRLDVPALHGPRGLIGPGNPSAQLAAQMHEAWVRYARTGDPGWAASHPPHFTG